MWEKLRVILVEGVWKKLEMFLNFGVFSTRKSRTGQ